MPALRATLEPMGEDRVNFIMDAIYNEKETIDLRPNHPKLGGAFCWSKHSFGYDYWKWASDTFIDTAYRKQANGDKSAPFDRFVEVQGGVRKMALTTNTFDPAATNSLDAYRF